MIKTITIKAKTSKANNANNANNANHKNPKNALAEAILAAIKANTMPWRKSWKNDGCNRPYNPITKTIYRGSNAMTLYLPLLIKMMADNTAMVPEFRFSTFKQIKDEGMSVKKGSKGFPIFYWGTYTTNDDDTEEKVKMCIKHFTVFNYQDVDIPEGHTIKPLTTSDFTCDKPNIMGIINRLKIKIVQGNTLDPCYNLANNVIMMPDNFDDDVSKYTTLFHEIVHWTKNNIKNCKRELSYASEELVAELGSFMICHDLGIEYTPVENSNYYEYLRSWLSNFPTDEAKIDALNNALMYANRAVKAIME